jgi:hypothetical protein
MARELKRNISLEKRDAESLSATSIVSTHYLQNFNHSWIRTLYIAKVPTSASSRFEIASCCSFQIFQQTTRQNESHMFLLLVGIKTLMSRPNTSKFKPQWKQPSLLGCL